MNGQRLAYKRVSTLTQSTARQLDGLDFDEVFEDKLSGKDTHRPQLEAMMKHARKGDRLYCSSMDRMARNLDDLRAIVLGLTKRGVEVEFLKEVECPSSFVPVELIRTGNKGAEYGTWEEA